jgi:hypothetical protein
LHHYFPEAPNKLDEESLQVLWKFVEQNEKGIIEEKQLYPAMNKWLKEVFDKVEIFECAVETGNLITALLEALREDRLPLSEECTAERAAKILVGAGGFARKTEEDRIQMERMVHYLVGIFCRDCIAPAQFVNDVEEFSGPVQASMKKLATSEERQRFWLGTLKLHFPFIETVSRKRAVRDEEDDEDDEDGRTEAWRKKFVKKGAKKSRKASVDDDDEEED